MTRPIRAVKKEIRILGLDFCNKQRIVGAVFRGGYFLDGVMIINVRKSFDDRRIAQNILATRHYPELRGVMIHDPANLSNFKIIEKVVTLPVLKVSEQRSGRLFKLYRSKHGRLWVQTRLPDETVTKIISLTWTLGRLPEPARVAHVLNWARIPKALLQR